MNGANTVVATLVGETQIYPDSWVVKIQQRGKEPFDVMPPADYDNDTATFSTIGSRLVDPETYGYELGAKTYVTEIYAMEGSQKKLFYKRTI